MRLQFGAIVCIRASLSETSVAKSGVGCGDDCNSSGLKHEELQSVAEEIQSMVSRGTATDCDNNWFDTLV